MTIPPAPHPRAWPSAVRTLIAQRQVSRTLAMWGTTDRGRALGWQRLLVATYAGKERGGVRLPYRLTVDEAYKFATEDLTNLTKELIG